MPARKTANEYGQGGKAVLAFGAVCALSGFAIWLITGRSFQESFKIGCRLMFVLVFAWFFVAWLYGRKSGGEVLLDCGPHPWRKLFLLNAGLILVSAALMGLGDVYAVWWPVFGLMFALYWVVLAMGRLQIREDGIWMYCALMRWEKIGSYDWGKDSTLFLRGKGWLAALFGGVLRVAPEQRTTFEEFLERKCSATHVT